MTFSARWRSGLRPSTARSRRTRAGTSQPAPARVRASGDGPAESGGEPAVALGGEDRGGLGQPAQLGQRLGERRPGRVQAADDQQQAAADPGATDQGEDHAEPPRCVSGVASSGRSVRNRSTLAGRVMRASQTNAVANTAPTKTRTSWPTAVS